MLSNSAKVPIDVVAVPDYQVNVTCATPVNRKDSMVTTGMHGDQGPTMNSAFHVHAHDLHALTLPA